MTYCDGSAGSYAASDAVIDFLPVVSGLVLAALVDNPPGSGNFDGTKVIVDNVEDVPGGQRSIKCTTTWHLQKKLAGQ